MNKDFIKKYRSLVIVLVCYGLLGIVWPEKLGDVLPETQNFLAQVALILPVVLILMELFEVWVPKSMIQKYMGTGSGVRGMALAFLFGTAPTGPLYVAFPIAVSLLRKGARVSNVTIFLGAWAAAKVPQIMVEVQFLGPKFAALRLSMTIAAIIIIGFLVESFTDPVKEKGFEEEA